MANSFATCLFTINICRFAIKNPAFGRERMTRRSWFPETALLLAVITAVVSSLPRDPEAGIVALRVSAPAGAPGADPPVTTPSSRRG